jgi:2-polyprenyl-3-methyl-5-hydroxy-6-metoxy-1,4-benzoquinol methylase
MPRNFEFRQAEIDSLPFEDRSFPVVSCVDVIEHLPLDVRAKAIDELVRVAGQTLVVAFPHGSPARQSDGRLLADFLQRGLEPPDWVVEHLRQAHPTDNEIEDRLRNAAAARSRQVSIRTRYCEPLLAQQLVRMSSRTRICYFITSLTMGVLLPVLRTPTRENAYRAVLVVELSD